MLVVRSCAGRKQNGDPCRVAPLRDGSLCFWHDPEHADAAAEARRLGGLRRRKESTIAGAYEFDGIDSVPQIRRLIEIVVADALSMENSIARGRLIIAAVQAAARLLEVGELENRLEQVETALGPRLNTMRRRR